MRDNEPDDLSDHPDHPDNANTPEVPGAYDARTGIFFGADDWQCVATLNPTNEMLLGLALGAWTQLVQETRRAHPDTYLGTTALAHVRVEPSTFEGLRLLVLRPEAAQRIAMEAAEQYEREQIRRQFATPTPFDFEPGRDHQPETGEPRPYVPESAESDRAAS